MSTPSPPPDDAEDAFHLAFQEWDALRSSIVAVALVCADAWTEGDTPIADSMDRLCKVIRAYKDAEAAIKLLDEAARKQPRAPKAP